MGKIPEHIPEPPPTAGKRITRRGFLKNLAKGSLVPVTAAALGSNKAWANSRNPVYRIFSIREDPFCYPQSPNCHSGVEALLYLTGSYGLKFYRSATEDILSGPGGLIDAGDVVLIKVNAQWKYRGCTNSDVVRGLVQRILDHPDGFTGEVVIFENGQGRGSLDCDTSAAYGNSEVHANANDESHTFLYLVNTVFNDPRVSAYLLDPISETFIGADDHITHGYRTFENVSYPCFNTPNGTRIELKEGIWNGAGYDGNLKLINVPVLKHHDVGGSEITIALKHFYGVVSMADGQGGFRHYSGLGETCGKVVQAVRTPVLNIVDAIWTSLGICGWPYEAVRTNQLIASQDPVAVDYYAAKYTLYPIDGNPRHHPDFSGIQAWLTQARDTINSRGGLYNPEGGIYVDQVTCSEADMPIIWAGDVTGDGVVNSRDLGVQMSQWLGPGATDFNYDGSADTTDLAVLLRWFY